MSGKSQSPSDLNNLLAQQCMTFSAIMKAMQGSLNTENVLVTADPVGVPVGCQAGQGQDEEHHQAVSDRTPVPSSSR